MKAVIKSGTIKYNGRNVRVALRECKPEGNYATTKDGATYFSTRKTGYILRPSKKVED